MTQADDVREDEQTTTADRGSRSWRTVAGRLAVVTQAVAAAAAAIWLSGAAIKPAADPEPQAVTIPAQQVAPAPVEPGSAAPATVDTHAVVPVRLPRNGGQEAAPLPAWADRASRATGVPARALLAYGSAELHLRSSTPGCRVTWTTLAAIGRIESGHGQFGGTRLGADGRPTTPIIGVPLDGSAGVKHIADTDGGRHDGDATLDRAVGPMQFIPSTWNTWAADGNGDGRADPQQIDDAALAAARYLCAGGRDMGSAQGWWAGVLSYNNSVPYGQKVFGVADSYAKAAGR